MHKYLSNIFMLMDSLWRDWERDLFFLFFSHSFFDRSARVNWYRLPSLWFGVLTATSSHGDVECVVLPVEFSSVQFCLCLVCVVLFDFIASTYLRLYDMTCCFVFVFL